MQPTTEVTTERAEEEQLMPLKQLCIRTLYILIPTDVSSFLWVVSQSITLAFVGRYIGEIGVAQYTAGIIIFNMTGFSFIQGFGAAIDTLSSQAYGRDHKSPEVGEFVQFALLLDIVLGIIICIFFFNSETVMMYVFGPEVGPGVVTFLRWSPPYLLAQIVSGVLAKSMYAQKVPEIVVAANLAAACTAPIANYFLTPYGIAGATMSLFATTAFCALTHVTCCIFHPRVIVRYAAWPTPRLRDVASWKAFFRVGIPSLVATCAQWWAYNVQAIIASQISAQALAIHGVAMNLVSTLYSIALGVCVSASVMVGNALGAMQPRGARQYAYFIIVCDIVLGLITGILMYSFGRPIARIFSKEADMIDGVQRMMPIVILAHMGDSLQFCLQGIFRGAGRPKEAGIVVLATLWGVGVPASAILVLWIKVGVAGCLGGLLVGFLFEIPLLWFWMTRFDWDLLARKAQHSTPDNDVIILQDGHELNELSPGPPSSTTPGAAFDANHVVDHALNGTGSSASGLQPHLAVKPHTEHVTKGVVAETHPESPSAQHSAARVSEPQSHARHKRITHKDVDELLRASSWC